MCTDLFETTKNKRETTKNLLNVFKGTQTRFMQKINEILPVELKIYANLYNLLYIVYPSLMG